MPAGNGLLALMVRLVSCRLLHEVSAYAKREVRLVAVAATGFVGFLTFLLAAAAVGVVMLYAVLAPRFGPLASYGILIGGALVVALISLLIAVRAAKAFTRWEGARTAQPGANSLRRHRAPSDDDAAIALLISTVLEHLMPRPRRAPRS